MTKDLLWEIGLEEMPARFLPPAIKQMGELAAECFGNAGLSYEKLEVYATPRRLTLLVNGLAEKAADLETEVKGPARKAAYDENGQPTRALQGFCKGQGVDMADLQEKELNGNIYIFAKKKSVGQPTIELLPQILLTTVEKLYFPKPMRWGYNTLRFARPVRWLIALFGTDIINVSFGGVQADRYSRGHRLLGSRVVYEFPELQGIIGEYYALAAGEDKQVAQAIREHYLPRFAGDELPETKAGIAVALADKLDSIAGFFAMGIIPSGSQDPYALRRAAAGCVQIVIRHQIKLAFSGVLPYAFELIKADAASYEQEKTAERIAGVIAFLDQRAENILSDEGENYDVINAVHGSNAAASGDIMAMVRRARAIQAFRNRQAFGAMLAALTRAGNIIHSSKDSIGKQIDTSLLRDAAEKDLYAKLEAAEKAAGPALAADDLSKVLELLAGLAPSINNFFEAVMVNDPNAAIRSNRQALLRRILVISEQIGDFSQIVE